MFNIDFYPTPESVIATMIAGMNLKGKTVLEPSAGSGAIVRACQAEGANVIACENDPELYKIAASYCPIIERDFFDLDSVRVSHIHAIVMNPPFSNGADHVLHAYNIAPDGCEIVALCNLQTIKNAYSKTRKELLTLIENYGQYQNLGDVFATAERQTNVEVALIRLSKPGTQSNEFEGFFMDEEPEVVSGPGLIPYNLIRDLVQRYVGSLKIFDQQLETAAKLNEMAAGYFDAGLTNLSVTVNRGNIPVQRNEFKKSMQKQGWNFVFSKLNMEKHATKGLREDINKFVETQQNIPFTMANIYKMLEVVIGTTGSRMDKAILEVFDKVTSHHDENRYNIEGWKTNSHYLLTKRFIMPCLTEVGYGGEIKANYSSRNFEMVEDLIKALCYITGDNYDTMVGLQDFLGYKYFLVKDGEFLRSGYGVAKSNSDTGYNSLTSDQAKNPGSEIISPAKEWGKWFDWGYFRIRVYKKGTIHFEFKSEDVWSKFNQRVAKLKGYPLPESKKQTKYEAKQTHSRTAQPAYKPAPQKPVVLSTFQF
jgi:hypothetical protein